MAHRGLTAIAFVALGVAFRHGSDPGCGGVDDPEGRPNAPCTRSSDCGGELVCSEGVCRDRDAGHDAGHDAGQRDAGDSG